MKKTVLYLLIGSLTVLTSCKKDNEEEIAPEVSVETQKLNDDKAAINFLNTHYLDAKGKLQDYKDTDTVNVKLADMVPAPVTLPSGVIYIIKEGAQPDPGTAIGETDKIRIMNSSTSYLATEADGKVTYTSAYTFANNISGSGVPQSEDKDSSPFPTYFYYVPKSIIDAYNEKYKTTFDRTYWEIEGFREALQKFKAYDIPDESDYNLQGVIIVPSRAAFARDSHYNYTGISYRNRSIVFNFQVYKSSVAPTPR